jgi:hypothetical protein
MWHSGDMPNRSSSHPDVNQIAASIVAQLAGEPLDGRNPAAVALGRMGGLKGGPARAKKLSAAKRRRIAKKAANIRWKAVRKSQS